MDLSNCPCAGSGLARLLRPAIMAVLTAEPAHGYLVDQKLQDLALFAEVRPDRAGVYRALRDMEGEGLLESDWDLAGSGPARRCFRLTPAGRSCLARWAETLTDYGRGIAELVDCLSRQVGRRGDASP